MNSTPTPGLPVLDEAKRRFSILDSMIVIASVGIGTTIPRAYREVVDTNFDQIGVIMSMEASSLAVVIAWLVIASATVGLLILMSPRCSGRERLRRPGALAMFLAVLTWSFLQSQELLAEYRFVAALGRMRDTGTYGLFISPLMQAYQQAGLVILASWITLATFGRARPGPDWLDRTGCALGWVWIILGVSWQFLSFSVRW
jgi:hypothetical protein